MDNYRKIEDLIYLYTDLFDRGELDAFSKLFQDGELVMPAETHEQIVLHGADAVANWVRTNIRYYADGTPKTNHVMSNVRIQIGEDGHKASARSYLTVFQNVPADPTGPLKVIFCGRYHDTFINKEGQWSFARREILATSLGDLSAHVIGF